MTRITDRLHQTEYTGTNRCIPCTVVNIIIASFATVVAFTISSVFGIATAAVSVLAIYFRGYIIPGTPTLTERYLPDYVLKWFDKEISESVVNTNTSINPEQILLDAQVVDPCKGGRDLCLTSEFRKIWRKQMQTVRTQNLNEGCLMKTLNLNSEDTAATIDEHGDGFIVHADGVVIGQWSSRAAIIADVAAATELTKRLSDWSSLAPAEITRVLMSLRIFVEQCPECGGTIHVGEEIVESCCRSHDVVASSCQNCGTRLFEIETNEQEMGL